MEEPVRMSRTRGFSGSATMLDERKVRGLENVHIFCIARTTMSRSYQMTKQMNNKSMSPLLKVIVIVSDSLS